MAKAKDYLALLPFLGPLLAFFKRSPNALVRRQARKDRRMERKQARKDRRAARRKG